MATAETWYLDAVGWPIDEAALPSAPVARLAAIREQVEAAFPTWAGSASVVRTSGEAWTPWKVLRRAIWHERDHSRQITTILAHGR